MLVGGSAAGVAVRVAEENPLKQPIEGKQQAVGVCGIVREGEPVPTASPRPVADVREVWREYSG